MFAALARKRPASSLPRCACEAGVPMAVAGADKDKDGEPWAILVDAGGVGGLEQRLVAAAGQEAVRHGAA